METRQKILELAEELIRTKGYNAFSYKDISEALQVKNAAIHYHFPSKSDLGVAVIENAIQRMNAQHEKWLSLPEDVQLKNLCKVFKESHDKGMLCLQGALTPEYATFSGPMQEKVQEICTDILGWVSTCLENGRKKKIFRFEGTATDKALTVVSNLLSSLLLARVLGKKVFSGMQKQLMSELK